MTTTAFAAACLLDPWDDTPRLVFADWLAEHGDEDRANLIRLQIELERMDDCGERSASGIAGGIRAGCQPCDRRASISAILSRHTGDKATGERWDRLLCGKCKGKQYIEGRPTRDHPSGILECPVCGGSGDLALRRCMTCEGRGRFCSGECRGSGYVPRYPHWDRGFLHLGCTIAEAVEERECEKCGGDGYTMADVQVHIERVTCKPCSGTGRIPTLTAWGRAVVEAGVGLWLEGVEPTDCGEGLWVWNFGTEPGTLPRWLAPFFSTNRLPSSSAAKLSLARAFTAWSAREHANV